MDRPEQDIESKVPHLPGYAFRRILARGASGQVWIARHIASGELRAVKIVRRRDQYSNGDESYHREWSGLTIMTALASRHPRLVPVLDRSPGPEGDEFFYSMSLADRRLTPRSTRSGDSDCGANALSSKPEPGTRDESIPADYAPRTLRSDIQDRAPIPIGECLRLALEVLEALEFLHRHGFVHRDVKPSNILFFGGRLRLGDPGLVSSYETKGVTAGTPGYCPTHGAGTVSGDLYALGKVLYEMATGRWSRDVAELPTITLPTAEGLAFLEFQELLLKACSEEVGARYGSASAMRRDIEFLLRGGSLRRREIRRRLGRQAIFIAGIGSAVAGLLSFGWKAEQRRRIEADRLAEERKEWLGASMFQKGDQALAYRILPEAALWYASAIDLGLPAERAEQARERLESIRNWIPRLTSVGLHEDTIHDIAFCPDSTRFVTASGDRTARIWDVGSGNPVGPALVHPSSVTSAIFSPNGKALATGCQDGTVWIWDARKIVLLHGPLAYGGEVEALAFTPDSRLVVGAGRTHFARVWDVQSGKVKWEELPHSGNLNDVEVESSGHYIATASNDGTACVWNVETGSLEFGPFTHEDHVRSVSFGPEGKSLLTAGKDGMAKLWDIGSGGNLLQTFGHVPLYDALFLPEGGVLTAGGNYDRSGEAHEWDSKTGKPISSPIRHSERVRDVCVSPDGRWIVTAGHDRVVTIRDRYSTERGECRLPHGGSVSNVRFSPDGRWLLSSGKELCWRLWDFGSLAAKSSVLSKLDQLASAAFFDEGRRIVVLGQNAVPVRFFEHQRDEYERIPSNWIDLPSPDNFRTDRRMSRIALAQDHRQIAIFASEPYRRIGIIQLGGLHNDLFNERTVSPCRRWLASTDSMRSLKIWDIDTQRLRNSFPIPPPQLGNPQSLEFGAKGTLLALSVYDANQADNHGELLVVDVPIGRILWREPVSGAKRRQRFSPDERWLLSAAVSVAGGSEFRLLDARTGKEVSRHLMDGSLRNDYIFENPFSPDGRWVAATSGGMTRVLSVPLFNPGGPDLRNDRGNTVIAWRPDSRRLAIGGLDGRVRIFDPFRGVETADVFAHPSEISTVAFSSDARFLLTACHPGLVQLWKLPGVIPGKLDRVGIETEAACRIDASGNLAPLDARTLHQAMVSSRER